MQCISKILVKSEKYPKGVLVPCSKCMACKVNHKDLWKERMRHESNYHASSVFVTLTYNDENVPINYSLKKRHLQLFIKRLRKKLVKLKRDKIRYYACGEYGDKRGRPHYHLIIFGMGFSYQFQTEYQIIKESWNLGNVHLGRVNDHSIQYVAKYIQKCYNGQMAEEIYDNNGRERPFKLSSLGLGKQYALDNEQFIKENLYLRDSRGTKKPVPRYYRKLLDMPNEPFINLALANSTRVLEEIGKRFIELGKSYTLEDLHYQEYLFSQSRYKNLKASVKHELLLDDNLF